MSDGFDLRNSTTMLTNQCPYCQSLMEVTRMACAACQCAIEGQFATTRLGRLPSEHQRFIEIFLLAGGNLKEIAQQAGVSYPTVRSRLDKVIDALRAEISASHEVSGTPLDAVGDADDSADEAARIIKAI
ncbi:MAG TPA: DUF2089 family protein [Lacipirellula sp.]